MTLNYKYSLGLFYFKRSVLWRWVQRKGLSDLKLKGNCISVLLVVIKMDSMYLLNGVKRDWMERFF